MFVRFYSRVRTVIVNRNDYLSTNEQIQLVFFITHKRFETVREKSVIGAVFRQLVQSESFSESHAKKT